MPDEPEFVPPIVKPSSTKTIRLSKRLISAESSQIAAVISLPPDRRYSRPVMRRRGGRRRERRRGESEKGSSCAFASRHPRRTHGHVGRNRIGRRGSAVGGRGRRH